MILCLKSSGGGVGVGVGIMNEQIWIWDPTGRYTIDSIFWTVRFIIDLNLRVDFGYIKIEYFSVISLIWEKFCKNDSTYQKYYLNLETFFWNEENGFYFKL